MATIGDSTQSLARQLIVAARRVQKSGHMGVAIFARAPRWPRRFEDDGTGPGAQFYELRFDAPVNLWCFPLGSQCPLCPGVAVSSGSVSVLGRSQRMIDVADFAVIRVVAWDAREGRHLTL